jgi:hypothetical protein
MRKMPRLVFLMLLPFGIFGSEHVSPNDSARYINKVAPTTRPWYEADDSLKPVNAGWGFGSNEWMIKIMKDGLLAPPPPIEQTFEASGKLVTEIAEALYRSGDSPEITNTLYQALVAPTNHYREVILHAYVMASPVPMTFLAETVVKRFPAEQRKAWYIAAWPKALRTGSRNGDQFVTRPSREALRHAHFLYTAKQFETDPECLTVIMDPIDPKREPAKP